MRPRDWLLASVVITTTLVLCLAASNRAAIKPIAEAIDIPLVEEEHLEHEALRDQTDFDASPPSVSSVAVKPPFKYATARQSMKTGENQPPVLSSKGSRWTPERMAAAFLPQPSRPLPPLPNRPKYTRLCGAVHGVVMGLQRAGLSQNSSAEGSSIIVPCNSRALAPELVAQHLGKKLITNIIGVVSRYCLGSRKNVQLACRRELVRLAGCPDYNTLGIQPPQFLLPAECEAMLQLNKSILIKPGGGYHGIGIEFWSSPPTLEHCKSKEGAIGQVYIDNPALLSGSKKFDLRTWVLVAHLDPLIVFHADGFIRVSTRAYALNDSDPMIHITNAHGQEKDKGHFRTFAEIEPELARNYGWPPQYFATKFRSQVDRAVRVAVLAQFKTSYGEFKDQPRVGFMHVFAADWILDSRGGVHLLELNGLPDQTFKVAGDNARWANMMALVLMLHWEPHRLLDASLDSLDTIERAGIWKNGGTAVGDRLAAGQFRFGPWRLIFNELETAMDKVNVCAKE